MIIQPEFYKIDTPRNVPSDRVPQSDLLIHVMRTKILHGFASVFGTDIFFSFRHTLNNEATNARLTFFISEISIKSP